MRHRNTTENKDNAYWHYIMLTTNRLIRDGLATNCLEAISKHLTTLQSTGVVNTRNGAFNKRALLQKTISLLSEAIFFIFYSTQILLSEERALVSQIRSISGLLAESPEGQVTEWRASLFPVLVTLQLSHLGALNQTSVLFQRTIDTAPYYYPPDREPGNELTQVPGNREGMDQPWTCGLARGFCCLAYAVLRQPSVETGECPRADVLWFLRQAAALRAYSYTRLCILPVLQTFYYDRHEMLSFMVSLLYELFENLVHIFSMPMYQLHSRGQTLELLPFFPLSQAQFSKDQMFAIQAKKHELGVMDVLGDEFNLSDCLDDVMLLLGVLCAARPSFADIFWQGDGHHPFIGRVVEFVTIDSSLIASVARMLAGTALAAHMARGSLSSLNPGSFKNSMSAFGFIKVHVPRRFDWSFIFGCIEQYAHQLSSKQPGSGGLSPKDTDALVFYFLEVTVSNQTC